MGKTMTKHQYIAQLKRFTHVWSEDIQTVQDECEVHGIAIDDQDWIDGQDDCIYFPEIEHALQVWEE